MATDSVAFLWATTPFGADPYDVLKQWGFRFKTEWYWHKTGKKGTGYWTRGCVEKVLIGVRGSVRAWRSSLDNWIEGGWNDDPDAFDGVFESRPEGHSQKPPVVRQMIEHLTGHREPRRVELFATERCEGWDSYGLALDPSHDFRDQDFWAQVLGRKNG